MQTEAATFVLTDVRGQTVHTGTFSGSGTVELALPQLQAGTYILTVQTAEQVWRQKVVLQ